MHTLFRALVAPTLALAIGTSALHAQDSTTAPPTGVQPVTAMGQPPIWQFHTAGLGLFDFRGDGSGGSALLGVHHTVLNPVTGLLGGTGEIYGTGGGAFRGFGGRLLASSRLFGLSAGADWNLHARRVDFMLSYQTAVLRGGLLGHGTMLRADWLPTRGRTLGVGVQVPLRQPFAGRTRPKSTRVPFAYTAESRELATGALDGIAETALASVASAASLIRAYTSVATEDEVHTLGAGEGYNAAMRRYDDALVRAFASSANDTSLGTAIAVRARAGLLSDVLLPFDALFGQVKDEANIRTLTSRAHATFARWLRDSSAVAPTVRPMVLSAHARWLGIIEQVHASLHDAWKDSRSIWLPLQLALTPGQYDEQTETDSLLGRMIGRSFTDQNALTMLRSADLPLEIARSIYAARTYHVLWTHDFAGHALETGELDKVSYSMVADAYFPALTAAVKRYDQSGRLPLYMILLDQFFYEPNGGRLWMTILEDPLAASTRLPGDNAVREEHLRQRQQELREAVAGSSRLQAEARRSGGDAWLRNAVKVHVSITYPADFSFRSRRIVPPIPFTPDNIIRDHRKIVFYDLDEADPYEGAMMLMGIGIGEHYASTSWEDRGYRLRGPAAIEARTGLRRLLRSNGFSEEDIPMPLREVTSARAAERAANVGDYVGRALQVHNEVGFGAKQSSVARAMLYNLALPGSVIIVPDPLWLSREWVAMLAGAATRGSRVYVIAPALANAPSPEAPVMALAHDAMLRLLELRDRLGARMKTSGGELRVGLFAAHAQVDDAAAVQREVRDGLRRAPWIRGVIPFDSATLAVLDRAQSRAASDGRDATALTRDVAPRPPQLHQKTQLIARPGAIAALVRQPGWEKILARAMQTQSQETTRFAEQLGYTTPNLESEATRSTDMLLRGYEQAIPEAERKQVSFYFALGTHNQDARGMMLDGEATLLVSGFYAAAGLVDLHDVMARSTWIETPSELEALLPPRSALMQRVANWLRVAF